MSPQRCAVIDGELVLEWPATHVVFDGNQLRDNCRCAECRYLALTGIAHKSNEAVKVLAASPLGYGLQLHFSDGHQRGVFPWACLLSLATP